MYENLPPELKAEKAWVNVWNWSKIPMQTTVRKGASSVQPETWGTFEDAVKNVEDKTYHGIGYVFHDNGVIGIDIDTGYDEDGFMSSVAVDIIGRCCSYTEKSRSGRGFHILLRGDLPFKGKNNREGVEIYKASRYFIMTGKKMLFSEIIENQEAIDYVVATYFPELPREEGDSTAQRIYSPIYPKPEGGKIFVQPTYPPIQKGGRNLSLTSLAGQLHSIGYPQRAIYAELLYANSVACKPPLDRSEVELIVSSVTKYRR